MRLALAAKASAASFNARREHKSCMLVCTRVAFFGGAPTLPAPGAGPGSRAAPRLRERAPSRREPAAPSQFGRWRGGLFLNSSRAELALVPPKASLPAGAISARFRNWQPGSRSPGKVQRRTPTLAARITQRRLAPPCPPSRRLSSARPPRGRRSASSPRCSAWSHRPCSATCSSSTSSASTWR